MFCEFSQCFSCFFTFSHLTTPHNTHTPYHTHFSLFSLVFSVFPHAQHRTTYTLTTTHTHTHMPTDRDLESGLSKSVSVNTRKNTRTEKGKVRGISGEGSFRYRRANRSSAAKWRKTNRTIWQLVPPEVSLIFQEKKRMICRIVNVLFSTYSQT